MEVCPRCGTRLLQDIRTWCYLDSISRHVCPICVFQGAREEDPRGWPNFKDEPVLGIG